MTAAAGFADKPASVAVSRPTPDELFTNHVRFVWRSLRYFHVRDADLEDQTHEVFLIAYRRLSRSGAVEVAPWEIIHVRAWLYAIARRRATAYHRSAYQRRELLVEEVPEQEAPSVLSARMELDRLDRLLSKLDEDKRAVFILFEIEDMSMQEVAQAVGCPVQTAYARLYAARRHLAEKLSEE